MRLPTIFIDVVFLMLLQYFSISTLTMYNTSTTDEATTPEINLPADERRPGPDKSNTDPGTAMFISAKPSGSAGENGGVEYFISGSDKMFSDLASLAPIIREMAPDAAVLRIDQRLSHAVTVKLLLFAQREGIRRVSIAYDTE